MISVPPVLACALVSAALETSPLSEPLDPVAPVEPVAPVLPVAPLEPVEAVVAVGDVPVDPVEPPLSSSPPQAARKAALNAAPDVAMTALRRVSRLCSTLSQ